MDNVSTYDFSFAPAPFYLNGEKKFMVKTVEFRFNHEDVVYGDDMIISKWATAGTWVITDTEDKKYIWQEGQIKMSFFKDDFTTPGSLGMIKAETDQDCTIIYPSFEPPKLHVIHNNPASEGIGRRPEVAKLPGIREKVKHPISENEMRLEDVIINLNDDYKWTRHQIADWLETLDIDIKFKVKEEPVGS